MIIEADGKDVVFVTDRESLHILFGENADAKLHRRKDGRWAVEIALSTHMDFLTSPGRFRHIEEENEEEE